MAPKKQGWQAGIRDPVRQRAHLLRGSVPLLLQSPPSLPAEQLQTAKIGSLVDVNESEDPEGLRVFYYLVQDLKALVFSLISLHFKVTRHMYTSEVLLLTSSLDQANLKIRLHLLELNQLQCHRAEKARRSGAEATGVPQVHGLCHELHYLAYQPV